MKGMFDNSSYQVMPLDAGSLEKIQELMEAINSNLNSQGIKSSNIRKKETKINGNRAYEVIIDVTDKEGRKGILYEVGIFKEDTLTGLLFSGTDADNGIYLDKIKATAQSIRL